MFANLLAEELNFFQKSGGFILVLLLVLGATAAAAIVIWLFKVAKPQNKEREDEVKAFNANVAVAAEEPVEEKVEEPAPVEEPVEEKVEEPAPVEEPVEEKVEEPAPVEEPVEEKVEEPAPVEEPVEEKAEEPAPVEEPVEEKVEEPVAEETPAEEAKEEKKAPAKKPAAKKPAAKKAPAKKPAAKKAPAKKAVAAVIPAEKNDDEIATGANGKWRIEKEDVGFVASLFANNGQLLLNSESYTTFKGAAKGIETIKKNAESGVFHVTEDKNGRYFFKLLSKQNRLICIGATYASKDGCESAIDSVRNFCKTAILVSVDPDEAAKAEAAAAKN